MYYIYIYFINYYQLKEYFIKSEESMNKLRLNVKASLPRGIEFKIPKNSRRNCLEVRYEWESTEE